MQRDNSHARQTRRRAQEAALVEIARQYLDDEFDIRLIQERGRFALPANGKFEEFVCRAA